MYRSFLFAFSLLICSHSVFAMCIRGEGLEPLKAKALARCVTQDREFSAVTVSVKQQYILGSYCLSVNRDDLGVKWLTEAAKNNDALAQLLLGSYYAKLADQNSDTQEKSLALLNQAIANTIGFMQQDAKLAKAGALRKFSIQANHKMSAQALVEFEQLAKEGYVPAMKHLGTFYDQGSGVPKNDIKAVYWYEQLLNNEKKYMQERYPFRGSIDDQYMGLDTIYRLVDLYSNSKSAKNLKKAQYWQKESGKTPDFRMRGGCNVYPKDISYIEKDWY